MAGLAWPGGAGAGEEHRRPGLEGAAAKAQGKEEGTSVVLEVDFRSCQNGISESQEVLGW